MSGDVFEYGGRSKVIGRVEDRLEDAGCLKER